MYTKFVVDIVDELLALKNFTRSAQTFRQLLFLLQGNIVHLQVIIPWFRINSALAV